MISKDSMFYWWPRIKDLPINTPQTVLVPLEGDVTFKVIDGKPDEAFDTMIEKAIIFAEAMGYPVFVRSDEMSNKFDWENSCYVTKSEDMRAHVCSILEATAMAFGPRFRGVAVREFLELDSAFTAFWGKMPVAKEIRAFVRDGVGECWHPYWPMASIKNPSISHWREELQRIQTYSPTDLATVKEIVETVGRAMGGYWSIDICQTKAGNWYVTDMATGENSYHWGTCPHAPSEMLEQYGDPEGSKG